MPTDFARISSDLQWLMQTPPLLRLHAPWQTTPQGLLAKTLQCPAPPEQKAVRAAAKITRLGIYYEWMWQQLLQELPLTTIHNLTISDQQRTVGEFDLLYRDTKSLLVTHRELALKFYLLTPGERGDQPWHWVGPNTSDRLDLKIGKLAHQQIKLGDHPAARAKLHSLGLAIAHREILLQGRLFYPGLTTTGAIAHPAPIHPSAPWGYWMTQAEVGAWMHRHPGAQWFALEKLEWISGSGQPVSAKTLMRNPKTGQYRLEMAGHPPTYVILVDNSWPVQAKKSLDALPPKGWPQH